MGLTIQKRKQDWKGVCTLSSALKIQRCSSRHITGSDVRRLHR